jgi:hypothetical protein
MMSSLGQDDGSSIIECWYFILLLVSKLRKLHLLNYSDINTSIYCNNTFMQVCNVCGVLCIITSVMTPRNNPGCD